MSVRHTGFSASGMLTSMQRLPERVDRAAQAHAEEIVAVAADLGYIRSIKRQITATGSGVREVTDPGIPMTWLIGKTVPLGGGLTRKVSAQSLAEGHWYYPGRVKLMEDANRDPSVQHVVSAQVTRLFADLFRG